MKSSLLTLLNIILLQILKVDFNVLVRSWTLTYKAINMSSPLHPSIYGEGRVQVLCTLDFGWFYLES